MEYWLSAHNGVVGVAGSNPVVPTNFRGQRKRTGLYSTPNQRNQLTQHNFSPITQNAGGWSAYL